MTTRAAGPALDIAETEVLLRPEEVAEFLNKPRGTLNQWAHRGVGPRFIKVGGSRRYPRSELLAWLNAQASGGGEADGT
jgi:excisionase family DNA binding protein